MNKLKNIICGLGLIIAGPISLMAQDIELNESKKAWEFGLGGSVYQFSRTSLSNFSTLTDNGHKFDLKLDHVLWGGNVYVARELNPYLYLDLQGTVGFTKDNLVGENKNRWYAMVGPGIQWRFGQYFNSKYIEPYLRAGINYMYKDFDMNYQGSVENVNSEEMKWLLENIRNKEGRDKTHMMPISVGAGLQTWLNDRWGIGMQGDYLIMPYKNVANSIQGTVRVMYRLGGKSKKVKPAVEYVEIEREPIVVEKIVEKPIEKIVIKEVSSESELLSQLFTNIRFEFDKDVMTKDSEEYITKVIDVLKKDTSKHYLITGYTDAKGSNAYNIGLSKRRASAVVDKLVDEGLPKSMFKTRGLGSKASHAAASSSNVVREGDRKVTIEFVSNADYWDYLGD